MELAGRLIGLHCKNKFFLPFTPISHLKLSFKGSPPDSPTKNGRGTKNGFAGTKRGGLVGSLYVKEADFNGFALKLWGVQVIY